MGLYSGKGMSNIVKIKDPDTFDELLRVLGCKMIHVPGEGFGFTVQNSNGEPVKYVTVDILDQNNSSRETKRMIWTDAIAEHLLPGEVLIFQHSGSDDVRINAYSLAISWKGQIDFIHIDDIYKRAARKFNSDAIKPVYHFRGSSGGK